VHRSVFLVAGVAGALLLASCGDETVTATESASGLSVSIVVTSDSTGIAAIEKSVKGSGATVTNGDTHAGAHVCGFNVSKNGHTYQVDVYGSVPASTCSDAAKSQFLAEAP
jgi:hypothetical protein